MKQDLKDFSDSAKGFSKSPLGIIALFIVLVYGFTTLTVTFGGGLGKDISLFIYFLVSFPIIVLFSFLWLVSKHHDKIYGPSDFKDEANFIKTIKIKMHAVAALAVATSKEPKNRDNTDTDAFQNELTSIVELVLKTYNGKIDITNEWKNKILWVDDIAGNNTCERQAFESQGIEFSLALSTDAALDLLKHNKYAVIISDMGRKEGDQEGYVLLNKLRSMGDKTPFYIYAGSNLPEHKSKARKDGAQGSTNNTQELYKMVMDTINGI